jgi:mRNA interferase MazF
VNGEFDVTLAFISTQLKWKEATDIILNPSEGNGLKKESLVRLSKLATIDKDLVLGRLGTVNRESIKLINDNLKKIFQLEE